MNVIRGETFENEAVWLDFTSYINCTFIDCNIILERGVFALNGCTFTNCKLSMRGPARNIITVAKMFYPEIPIANMKLDFKEKESDLDEWR